MLDLLDRFRDRLAVRDLRLPDVRVDVELADHAVDEHLEVELTHAGDDRLAGVEVGADLERRVLVGERVERLARACPGRPWSWARSPREMTGSGNSMRSRMIGCARSQSVSPVVVCLKPRPATMSPA